MIIISIDTSSHERISVVLSYNGKEFTKVDDSKSRKSQVVIPLIMELLQEQKLLLTDIQEIQVNVGPGSFTGLKVGVSIANTLGMALHIPINGKKVGELVEPQYE